MDSQIQWSNTFLVFLAGKSAAVSMQSSNSRCQRCVLVDWRRWEGGWGRGGGGERGGGGALVRYLGCHPSARRVVQLLTSLPLEPPSGPVKVVAPLYAPLRSTAAIMSCARGSARRNHPRSTKSSNDAGMGLGGCVARMRVLKFWVRRWNRSQLHCRAHIIMMTVHELVDTCVVRYTRMHLAILRQPSGSWRRLFNHALRR